LCLIIDTCNFGASCGTDLLSDPRYKRERPVSRHVYMTVTRDGALKRVLCFFVVVLLLSERQGRRKGIPNKNALFFELGLAFDCEASEWNRLEPRDGNRFARHLANAVGALFNALQGFIYLHKSILFLVEKTKSQVAIAGISPGIARVCGQGRSVAASGARIFCNQIHRICKGAAQVKELFFLRVCEAIRGLAPPLPLRVATWTPIVQ